MFIRRRKASESPRKPFSDPPGSVVELDEDRAQRLLYGRENRSGHVRLTPLRPDEFGRIAGLTDEWIEWDRIVWPFHKAHSLLAYPDRLVDALLGKPMMKSHIPVSVQRGDTIYLDFSVKVT